MSVEDFDRLAEPDELSYELDEGELVVITKPRPLHNRIVANLEFELRAYLKAHPIGEAFSAENLFVLGPNIKRHPMFRSSGRSAPNRSIPMRTSQVLRIWLWKCSRRTTRHLR